ncbi:MAG: DUF190 domain-containing protein [Bacteroidales bacterium]|jgi:PII-like signaling protein|nr:DUF190 domain-containing protein [Bacteroidales bacterium]
MEQLKNNYSLKIYASTTDKINHKLMYEYLVLKAKDNNLSGVSVIRGIMGYGASSNVHSSKFWELTEKLPITIEIIDDYKKLINFFELIKQDLNEMPKGCLVTLEPISVLLYKSGEKQN